MMLVRQPKLNAPIVRLVLYCDNELAVAQLLLLAGRHRRWHLTDYAQVRLAEELLNLVDKDQIAEEG